MLFGKLIKKYKIYKYLKQGLKIGENVHLMGPLVKISEPFMTEIGDSTLISSDVMIINHDGSLQTLKNIDDKYKELRKLNNVVIGKNCFIGTRSIILGGATIGDNVIVGAGSLVRGTLESNSVYAGVPIKFICSLEDYAKKCIKNNTSYPRELDNNRKELQNYFLRQRGNR